MTITLIPCPVCGSANVSVTKIERFKGTDMFKGATYYACCNEYPCCSLLDCEFSTEEAAAAAWNDEARKLTKKEIANAGMDVVSFGNKCAIEGYHNCVCVSSYMNCPHFNFEIVNLQRKWSCAKQPNSSQESPLRILAKDAKATLFQTCPCRDSEHDNSGGDK